VGPAIGLLWLVSLIESVREFIGDPRWLLFVRWSSRADGSQQHLIGEQSRQHLRAVIIQPTVPHTLQLKDTHQPFVERFYRLATPAVDLPTPTAGHQDATTLPALPRRQRQYQIESGAAQRLLYEFLSPELKKLPLRHRLFRANRSMRDVEPSVNLWVKTLDNIDVEDDE
jgi:hypothetical protein